MGTYLPTKKGTDIDPATGLPPAVERLDGADTASTDAANSVDLAAAEVAAYLHGQRQNVACSVTDHHSSFYRGQNVDIGYINHRGQEQITVYPKPVYAETPEDETPEQVFQDELLYPPEPAAPTPPPVLYLMVLFQSIENPPPSGPIVNGIAAVRMDALASDTITTDYVGQSNKSQWVPQENGLLQTLQLTLDKQAFILSPIDFTGKAAAKTWWVMTTALDDGVATVGDLSAIPVMTASSGGETLYTHGGAFQYSATPSSFFSLQGMATEGGRVVEPCAIGKDGTCYYFPTITGYSAVQLDGKSIASTSPSSAALSASVLQAAQTVTLGEAPIYTAGAFTKTITSTLDDETGPVESDKQTNITNVTKTVISFGPVMEPSTIVAQAYYGAAKMGMLPSAVLPEFAVGETDVASYDIGSNQNQLVTVGQGGQTAMVSALPLMVYAGTNSGSDTIDVALLPMSGSAVIATKGSIDTTQPAEVIAGGGASYQGSGLADDTTLNYIHTISYSVTYLSNPNFTYPPLPPQYPTVDEMETYAEALKAGTLSLPDISSSRDIICTELDVQSYSAPGVSNGSASGDAMTPDGFPVPSDSIIGAVSGSVGASQVFYSQAYIYLHDPYSPVFKFTMTGSSSASVFDDVMLHDFSGDGTPSSGTFKIHAFPPVLNNGSKNSGWYTTTDISGSQESVTVTTPYGVYTVSDEEAFTPWLHVSNGQHFLQGYYIGTTPYLYLDGGNGTNLIGAIAQACGCAPQEIVSMYMDITADAISAVTGVEVVDYSASTKGDPGPPPGKSSHPV